MHSNNYYYSSTMSNNKECCNNYFSSPSSEISYTSQTENEVINRGDISEFIDLSTNAKYTISSNRECNEHRQTHHGNARADHVPTSWFVGQSSFYPEVSTIYDNSTNHGGSLISAFSKNSKNLASKNVASVARRNARERRRIKNVNRAFDDLRKRVPTGESCAKISKVETLRSAIEYIRALQTLINVPGEEEESNKQYENNVSSTTDEYQEIYCT